MRHHNERHGQSASMGRRPTPEYSAWVAMKIRCTNAETPIYQRYGAVGIGVCARWSASFEDFLEDLGPRPSARHSLDRFPDRRGNYEPGNVRWATLEEQNRNRSSVRLTVDLASEILGRLEHGESSASIARRMAIGAWLVRDVKAGRTWKELHR